MNYDITPENLAEELVTSFNYKDLRNLYTAQLLTTLTKDELKKTVSYLLIDEENEEDENQGILVALDFIKILFIINEISFLNGDASIYKKEELNKAYDITWELANWAIKQNLDYNTVITLSEMEEKLKKAAL